MAKEKGFMISSDEDGDSQDENVIALEQKIKDLKKIQKIELEAKGMLFFQINITFIALLHCENSNYNACLRNVLLF